LLLASAGCSAPLPYGEVLLVVDTDLPVPELASRLRVDVYRADGSWQQSRDQPMLDARDWPASFGVYASTDEHDSGALVRLRAYPEGRLRDYRGERFAERSSFEEPFIAADLQSLCEQAIALPLGNTVVARRGHQPIVSPLQGDPDCDREVYAGSSAAYVDVIEGGSYRFEVLETIPPRHHVSLEVRGACLDGASALACASGINPDGSSWHRPSLTVDLEPGRYFVVTASSVYYPTGAGQGPTDLVVGAAREDRWAELDREPVNRMTEEPALPSAPLLLRGDPGATPLFEPEPATAVDRLVLVELTPGEVARARVTLTGACMGTMADIGASVDEQRAALDRARTCVDREGELVDAASIAESSEVEAPSESGSFDFREPCDDAPSSAKAACVPGGMFLFGGRAGSGAFELSSLPERLVRLVRFWIDRDEVTVARYRAALAAGFSVPAEMMPVSNDGPLGTSSAALFDLCTWSAAARDRESYPLNCIGWYGARALCLFHGGDLPSEAQWEYVASAAWRERESRYPWGDEPPDCDRAVYGRGDSSESDECILLGGFGPVPLEAYPDDSFPGGGGVRGLAGGLAEFVLDSFQSLSGACWAAAGQLDPLCWEEHAPRRGLRGGAWFVSALGLASETRRLSQPTFPDPGYGFRCVYPSDPG
jgi:formylglycine-generating enzyme required for sulfatase activity